MYISIWQYIHLYIFYIVLNIREKGNFVPLAIYYLVSVSVYRVYSPDTAADSGCLFGRGDWIFFPPSCLQCLTPTLKVVCCLHGNCVSYMAFAAESAHTGQKRRTPCNWFHLLSFKGQTLGRGRQIWLILPVCAVSLGFALKTSGGCAATCSDGEGG